MFCVTGSRLPSWVRAPLGGAAISRRLTTAFVGPLLLIPVALHAECPELAGREPGGIGFSAVAVAGDHAFIGAYSAFSIADISDPSVPRVVGEIGLPDRVRDVAVSGGYAYIATTLGLRVIDISTPTAPVEIGFNDAPAFASGVAVGGNYVYVADGFSLLVFDVSAPPSPLLVGYLDTPSYSLDVAVAGNYAHVADHYGGLRVIDVSDPTAPVEVGSVDTPVSARAVAVSGGYAYVADYGGGLRVIDVSAPSEPVEVGSWPTPRFAEGVAVSGDYAYFTDYGEGLRVIDVSTPSAPMEVGFLDTPDGPSQVAVSGGYAYVAALAAGLLVIDVSTPSAPVEIGIMSPSGGAWDVAVSEDFAYVMSGDRGLRVLDVSSPSAPAAVGSLDTPGWAQAVAVAAGHAYVADGVLGLRAIAVTTPSAPVEVGFLDTPGDAIDVAVSNGHAYVADGASGLRVIDVSLPSAPAEVGFVDTSGTARGVAAAGGYAYVADSDGGLRVIDISRPSAPVEVGAIDFYWESAVDVAVVGGYAYVAWLSPFPHSGGGLKIIDVKTPSAPVEVGSLGAPGGATGVAVSGAHAYLTWEDVDIGSGGLQVVDISTPSTPVETGSFRTPGGSGGEGVTVSDGRVFLAAGGAGLYVLWECAARDPRVSFIPAAAVAAGAQGAFFSTDVEINNTGPEEAQVVLQWLPRGEDNSEPVESAPVTLAPGQSRRYENALTELFGLEPDSLGALKMVSSTESVIGMSRIYNIPAGESFGTFGQGLPAIRSTEMIEGTEPRRITFLSETPDFRANVGCVNGTAEPVRINIEIFDDEGVFLETKTMDLRPYSNDQVNRVFEDYEPVNGYVDVSTDRGNALYSCYGSLLDNLTSDPTTILPLLPSNERTFIPAAALAAGLEGAFFQTDVDLNNVGALDITYELLWLPRGTNNSDPLRSDIFTLAPGAGVRYANILDEVFSLEPDQVGALAVEASGSELLAMSRTFNLPPAARGGTFGQDMPGLPRDRMVPAGERKRILFMSENDTYRANVGCQNGSQQTVRVLIELFNSEGESLEVRTMDLAPYSNNQVTRLFRDHAPISAGYVDAWTTTPGASIACYGSVLDNETNDPTTVLPQ